MDDFVARIAQELPLILIGCFVVAVVTAALFAWRLTTGTPWPRALVASALEAGIVASLLGIGALTLRPSVVNESGAANLIPFRSLFESFEIGPFWTQIVLIDWAANVILYVPLGLFVALRFRRLSPWVWLVATVALTAMIEIAQFVALNRSADINDVTMNTIGGMCGFAAGRAVLSVVRTLRRRPGIADSSASK